MTPSPPLSREPNQALAPLPLSRAREREGPAPARAWEGEGPLRWAIAGFGWVARDYFAPALAETGHRLVAVADPSPTAHDAARAAAATPYADLAGLLATERPDALYIATPNHLHRAAVEAAARARIPILCEKPLAATLADAEAIAIASAGVPFATAFDQRHHPIHAAMAARIAAGDIGTPTAIRIVYCCWVGPDWAAANWRADPAAAGGGAVIDLAPHGIDLVDALLGEPLVALDVVLQNRVHAYPVEDGGMLSGRTASGVLYQAHVAYNHPEALPRRRLEVIGTAAMLVATDSMGQTPGGRLVRIDGATGVAQAIAVAEASPFARQAQAFADMLAGRPHPFDIARDLDGFRLLDAAYRRAQSCR